MAHNINLPLSIHNYNQLWCLNLFLEVSRLTSERQESESISFQEYAYRMILTSFKLKVSRSPIMSPTIWRLVYSSLLSGASLAP